MRKIINNTCNQNKIFKLKIFNKLMIKNLLIKMIKNRQKYKINKKMIKKTFEFIKIYKLFLNYNCYKSQKNVAYQSAKS